MRSLRRRGPVIAIFHPFRRPPYGGSNQFLLALRRELEGRGIDVGANSIGRATVACIVNSFAFDVSRLRRQLHESCSVVHRVDGPASLYRGFDDGADARVVEINAEFARTTVLQSRYSLDAHRRLGLELRDPVVIPNAVDPAIFFPGAARPRGARIRLVATSWSSNPNKGGPTLAALEQRLDWKRFELTFVGQSPVRFERIETIPPLPSRELAEVLRAHDVYLAPSRNDPASNALLEGLACGLPAVHHASGGHAEIAGDAGIAFGDDDELPAALERMAAELAERRAAISIPPLARIADQYLAALGMT